MIYANKNQPEFQTAIIGAGFAGIGAAIQMQKSNLHSFIIFERARDIGGTWRENTYPGCGSDVPSHMYSYSFELNPNWSRSFSKQEEILNYIQHCTNKHQLKKHIQFNTTIKEAIFNENKGYWSLYDQSGNETTARTIIAALGPLNVPLIPKFKQQENYKGVNFHTSRWNHSFNLKGKRVAIIGTGASTIQIVPSIVDKVDHLFVFQRSAPWILPKKDGTFSSLSKSLFKNIPGFQRLYRELIYWLMEIRGKGLFGNKAITHLARSMAIRHINNSISDPELIKKVTPAYEIGCKRVLPSNDYYPALERSNVTLVTAPIDSFGEDHILDKNGNKIALDAIIYATGFEAASFSNRGLKIKGINGRDLFEEWEQNGPEAYYGIAAEGYPGLLFMLGPNTGLGHSSVIHMMESQINYILDYLEKLPENAVMDVKPSLQKEYNARIQKQLSKMVWASGCQSWYQTASGKNTTLWPGHTFSYRKQTKEVNLKDYNILPLLEKEQV